MPEPVSGFEVDLAAIGGTADTLRSTVDSMVVAVDGLDASACAALGPGRLATVAAGLVADTRRDLDRVLGGLAEDATLVEQIRDGYARLDQDVADRLGKVQW